jgi:hypothetical protein
MVVLKIRNVGNSLGTNTANRVTHLDAAFAKKMEKAEEIMARYRNTLRVLAK